MHIASMLKAVGVAAALSAGLTAMPAFAQQGGWPTRPVHIVLPSAPGGSSDPLARLVADELGKTFGQTFVVENKPGSNGNVGAAQAAKAAPDGQTLLFSWTGTLVSAVTMYGSKPFNPQRDFEPIVLIGSVPNVVVVNKDLPVNDLKGLIAYAKQKPGQLNYASTGSGSSWHLSAELLKKTAGISMLHVPYNSAGVVMTDLMSGQVQVTFPGSTAVAALARDGRVKALAVMADTRSESMPDVPSVTELGYPKLESATWFALLAPKGTPHEIVMKINAAVNQMLKTPAFRARIVAMGYTPMGGTPQEFAAYMDKEITKWNEVVIFSGAKIE